MNRCYHLISRIAHKSFFLDDGEKTRLVEYLWRAAEFSGVTVIAFCIMTKHFHVVAYVPDMEELSDREFRFRVRVCEPEEMSVREALGEIARRKEESASLAEGFSAWIADNILSKISRRFWGRGV